MVALRAVLLALVAMLCTVAPTNGAQAAPPQVPAGTLVLYDTTGQWGFLGDLYGQLAQNLASRFGPTHATPVRDYTSGQMGKYRSVIYVGSTYDEPLPQVFLDDVLAGTTEVLWAGANIWQLHNRANVDSVVGSFEQQYGWTYLGYDTSVVRKVRYKNYLLDRSENNEPFPSCHFRHFSLSFG